MFFWMVFCGMMGWTAVCAADDLTPQGRTFVVNLWPEGAPVDETRTENVEVRLHAFIPERTEHEKVPAVIICPGGGYGMLCIEPEGYGIARWLNRNGIAGFVVEYRLPDGRKMVPLADAQRAIRTVRANADVWKILSEKIGIIGFSAGGHLAASATVHFDAGQREAVDPVERVGCRPDFSILIYPVISLSDTLAHGGTRSNLLGEHPDNADVLYYSNELHVSENTPPTLLAHAQDDTVVSPENSRIFTEKMKQFHRPVVYLELEDGGHGLNGYRGTSWDRWQKEAIAWIRGLPDETGKGN
ncbi:MAG: alpha/beta hydrolase [Planctomycetia bacterium]|nr:alpha/beta hydrolase [Planctomycetia bacterium]